MVFFPTYDDCTHIFCLVDLTFLRGKLLTSLLIRAMAPTTVIALSLLDTVTAYRFPSQ